MDILISKTCKILTAVIMLVGGLILINKGKDAGSVWFVGGIILMSLEA